MLLQIFIKMNLRSAYQKRTHRLRNTAIALGCFAILYAAGSILATNNLYRRAIAPLEAQYRERVTEINKENRRVGIAPQDYLAREELDPQLADIIQARKKAYEGKAKDKSRWGMVSIGGDSLTVRIDNQTSITDPRNFFRN